MRSRGASEGIKLALEMDFEFWRPGTGLPLFTVTRLIKGRYPPVAYGEWGAVPEAWGCDQGLEVDLTQGVTNGCPSPEYYVALSSAWFDLGVLVDRLEKMGRLAVRMDGMGAESLYNSDYLLAQMYFTSDLLRDMDRLDPVPGAPSVRFP